MLADAYMEAGRYADSELVLTDLQQQSELTNFIRIRQIDMELRQSADGIYTLETDTLLRLEVETIAADREKEGHTAAEAMLYEVFDTYVEEVKLLPGNISGAKTSAQENAETLATISSEKEMENFVSVYPNPASDILTLSYQLPSENARIIFYTLTGQKAIEVELQGRNGTHQLSLTQLPAGIYVYSLEIEGEKAVKDKLVIMPK